MLFFIKLQNLCDEEVCVEYIESSQTPDGCFGGFRILDQTVFLGLLFPNCLPALAWKKFREKICPAGIIATDKKTFMSYASKFEPFNRAYRFTNKHEREKKDRKISEKNQKIETKMETKMETKIETKIEEKNEIKTESKIVPKTEKVNKPAKSTTQNCCAYNISQIISQNEKIEKLDEKLSFICRIFKEMEEVNEEAKLKHQKQFWKRYKKIKLAKKERKENKASKIKNRKLKSHLL